MFKYKSTGKQGLFGKDFASEKLSKLGNPLEKLHTVIDFFDKIFGCTRQRQNLFWLCRVQPKITECKFPAKEIRRKKTHKSSQAMAKNCGATTLTKNVRKTLTLVGLKKANNRIKSGTRSRVEHIFGFVTNSIHDFFSRCIGFKRIRGVIGLTNLFYNMFRYEQIVRLQLQPVAIK